MDLRLLVVLVFIYFGLPFLYKPLLVKSGQKVDPDPRVVPIDPSEWPQNVAQIMSRAEHDLYTLGFTITARYKMLNSMPNVSNMLTMLVNYQTGDKAMITAIWGNATGTWQLGTLYLEFSTRFEDGRCFDTMNSGVLSSFKHGPKDIKTQVPQIKDAAELWSVHRFVMRKHDAQGSKVVYDVAQAEAYLRRIWRQGFEEQTKFGRYSFDGQHFRPSLQGAYGMTWPLMWPCSAIRKSQMEARAEQLVREWKNASQSPVAASAHQVVIVPELGYAGSG